MSQEPKLIFMNLCFVFFGLSCATQSAKLTSLNNFKTKSMWDMMKSEMLGTWVAKLEDGRALRAHYKLIANDSVLVETYTTPSGRETMTVYHPDAQSLMLTHYCGQGNQVRLKLSESSKNKAIFRYLDASNLGESQSFLNEFSLEFKNNEILRTETYLDAKGNLATDILTFSKLVH